MEGAAGELSLTSHGAVGGERFGTVEKLLTAHDSTDTSRVFALIGQ